MITLIGILSAAATSLLTQGFKSYFTAKTLVDTLNQVAMASNGLMRELKNGSSLSNIDTTTFSFVNQTGQSIVINLSGTTLTRSVNGGTAQPLCKNVSNLIFSYYDQTLTSTATASNVRLITMQLTMNNSGLPYSSMTGTVLRTLLP